MFWKKLINSKSVAKVRNAFASDAVVKGSVKLLSGNLIAQAINFIASPILSRLYTKDVFGIYTVFVSILFISVTLMTAQYEQAIVIEEDRSGAKSLSKLCLHISSICLLPLAVFAYFYISAQNAYDGIVPVIGFVVTLTATCFFSAVDAVQSKILIKYRNYKGQSISQVLYTGSYVGAAIALHFITDTINALIYAYCFSEIVLCVSKFLFIRRIDGWTGNYQNREREMARKHCAFPKYSVASAFLNSLSTNMPSLVVQSLFGTALVGVYGMANKIVGIPFSIISASVSSVFYQEASNRSHETGGDMSEVGDSTFRKLTALSVLPMTALLVLGDYLFKWILGAEWEEAGRICQMLTIWMSVVFVVAPLMGVYNIRQKQYIALLVNVALLIFRAGALYLGAILKDSFTLSMLLYAVSGALIWAIVYYLLSKEIKMSFARNTLYFIKLYIPCAAVMLGIRLLLGLLF